MHAYEALIDTQTLRHVSGEENYVEACVLCAHASEYCMMKHVVDIRPSLRLSLRRTSYFKQASRRSPSKVYTVLVKVEDRVHFRDANVNPEHVFPTSRIHAL